MLNKLGKFTESISNPWSDSISAKDLQVAYGNTKDNDLEKQRDPLLGVKSTAILVGGNGSDRYFVESRGITIVHDCGNAKDEDELILSGFGVDRRSSVLLQIDGKHLLAFDSNTQQGALIVNWKNKRNRIEKIRTLDADLDYADVVRGYRRSPNYLGNFSARQIKQRQILDLDRVGIRPGKVGRVVDAITRRSDELQSPAFDWGVNQALWR